MPDSFGINCAGNDLDLGPTPQIASDGYKWVRTSIAWGDLEDSNGVYHWPIFDQRLAELARNGIRPLIMIIGNRRHAPVNVPKSDEDIAGFVNFARRCAARYREYHPIWELWNEPDYRLFWPPKRDSAEYIRLALATAKGLKADDPGVQIAAPAVGALDLPYLQDVANSGLLSYIDEFSIHLYHQWQPEGFLDEFARVRALLPSVGHRVGIIDSESGYPRTWTGITEEREAEYLCRSYLLGIVQGADITFLFEWNDHSVAGTVMTWGNLGINSNGQPTAARKALQNLIRRLNGYSLVSNHINRDESVYVLKFSNGIDTRLVGWTALGDPKNEQDWNRNPAGDPNASVDVQYGSRTLHLTGMPQVWDLK